MTDLASKLVGPKETVAVKGDKFLIIGSRPLSEDEIKVLNVNGKLTEYKEGFIRFDLGEIFVQTNATFLFFNQSNHNDRTYLSQHYKQIREYFVVLLKRKWEKNENWMADYEDMPHSVMKLIQAQDKPEYFFDYLKNYHKVQVPGGFLRRIAAWIVKLL